MVNSGMKRRVQGVVMEELRSGSRTTRAAEHRKGVAVFRQEGSVNRRVMVRCHLSTMSERPEREVEVVERGELDRWRDYKGADSKLDGSGLSIPVAAGSILLNKRRG